MEAKVFMLGDWVKLSFTPKNVQICMITPDEKVYASSNGDLKYLEWELNTDGDIEPIPITPEILEENGFEAFDDTFYSFENSWLTIRYSFGGHNLEIVSTCIQFDGEIDYVHELQHALRLCNIDKKIEL